MLKGGVVIPLIVFLMFPKIPPSSQTESLGFPGYPLPLNTPPQEPGKGDPALDFLHVPRSILAGRFIMHVVN